MRKLLYAAPMCASLFMLEGGSLAQKVNQPIIQYQKKASKQNESVDLSIQSYLNQMTEKNKLVANLKDLQLTEVKQSLSASHYHYQQFINGVPVEGAELIISISKNGNKIFRTYNKLIDATFTKKHKKINMDKNKAIKTAWNDLKVHGKLFDMPKSDMLYMQDDQGQLRLAYKTFLHIKAPYGAWIQYIDVETGEVIKKFDSRLIKRIEKHTNKKKAYKGKTWDYDEQLKLFQEKQKQKKVKAIVVPSTGSGLVFNPDPMTTLLRDNFLDNSPAIEFEDAYETVELQEISKSGNQYTLEGPWVTISDFESPSDAPSTSSTGTWTAKRGDTAFNDVMTYYHLDTNQRYIQSLGFAGTNGIQFGSIEVDANGVNGSDNSHFIPATNKLAFGHGCVDDNEDVDVILHEYGHAINRSINSSWSGGDTGAMGEGFGDYWAASYSISQVNGLDFNKNKVYTWDGIDSCWGGRILNAMGARYVHSTNYRAHASITGGFVSDELWSTPIFQALLEAMDNGIPREEMDTIVLEAQFGLGGGLKMRDMALSIIDTATRLYPDGEHGNIYKKHFLRHEIIDVPTASFEISQMNLTSANGMNYILPGQDVSATFEIKNIGTMNAKNTSAEFSSNSTSITAISNANSNFGEVNTNGVATSINNYEFSVASNATCGSSIPVKLTFNYDQAPVQGVTEFDLIVGKSLGEVHFDQTANANIPDNDSTGIFSNINVTTNELVSENFNIDIKIKHTYRGDLKITLISPSGTTVVLHDRTGSGTDDLIGNYPGTLSVAGDLSQLYGEPLLGKWILSVVDDAGSDTGKLESWGINDIKGYDCSTATAN